jgi:hypothetical protein
MLKCASYLTTQNQTTRGSQAYTNWVTYDYILQSFQLLKLFCHQKVLCIPVLGGSHIFVRPDWFWFSHRFVRTSLVLFSFSSFYLLRTVSIKKKNSKSIGSQTCPLLHMLIFTFDSHKPVMEYISIYINLHLKLGDIFKPNFFLK